MYHDARIHEHQTEKCSHHSTLSCSVEVKQNEMQQNWNINSDKKPKYNPLTGRPKNPPCSISFIPLPQLTNVDLAASLLTFLDHTKLETLSRYDSSESYRDQPVAQAATYTPHNKHMPQTSLPSAGFEPAIPKNRAVARLRTCGHWDWLR